MPVTFIGEHFKAVVFAVLVGPVLYGVALTILAMTVAWFRGNTVQMALMGMMSIVGAYVIAFIGFVVLFEISVANASFAGPVMPYWYFICIGAGTIGIIGSGVYCWVRPNRDDRGSLQATKEDEMT